MIRFRIKKDNEEHIWYNSSNLFYSKCFDAGEKSAVCVVPGKEILVPSYEITVVFKRGAAYTYQNVLNHDYDAFVNILNREDKESHGKAFNKFIKSYPCKRIDDFDMDDLKKLEDILRREYIEEEQI